MVKRNFSLVLSITLLLNLNVAAQFTSIEQKGQVLSDDYQRQLLQNNAMSLVKEVAKHSSALPNVGDRIELRIDASSIIWKFDSELAAKLLDKAWEETYSKDIVNEHYRDSERKKIIDVASEFAPERSKKWLKDTTEDSLPKPESVENENQLPGRQRADLVVRTAIASLATDQQGAVALALSTLRVSGRISGEFVSLIDALARLRRQDLVQATYKGIEE